ncbi:MAG TPA: hypothetical protein VHR45_15040 [Thermoanaerobaculia bacterium]|nr:hypothetical protein [Thermoanaerobaculia bacterium]
MRSPCRPVRRLAGLLVLGLCSPWSPVLGAPAAHAAETARQNAALPPPPHVAVIPPQPQAGAPLALVITGGPPACTPFFASPVVTGNAIVVSGSIPLDPPCGPGPWRQRVELPQLPYGSYTVDVEVNGSPYAALAFVVGPTFPFLSLGGTRFIVGLEQFGEAPLGNAVKLTDESGYFYFVDSANVEVTVKIIDGRAVNGRFWLFAASMTDRPYILRVLDFAARCPSAAAATPASPATTPIGVGCDRAYASLGSHNQNIVDVEAFGAAAPAVGASQQLALEINPRYLTTSDRVVIDVSGNADAFTCAPFFQEPVVKPDGNIIIQQIPAPSCTAGRWLQRFELLRLAEQGIYTVSVLPLAGSPNPAPLAVQTFADPFPSPGFLPPQFAVSLRWTDPAGQDHSVEPVNLGESLYFWLFDSANVEITVKILDGRPVNGHFWVFVASMTDLAFDLQIKQFIPGCVDSPPGSTCPIRHYVNTAHQNHNFIDVNAF